ncbi:MAG: hypothetical protein FJY55_16285 [Betaproteobacteria bacterium]|nr:hypothetical protein [Betaproteobacteria bacterium]
MRSAFDRDRILHGAIAACLLGSAALMAARVLFDQFDSDELQHTHLAWQVAQGKVLYRDFWDHHGPLATLLNAALLRLTGAAPGIDLMIGLRAVSAFFALLIAAFTWALAREVLGSARAAWLSVTALLLAYYFQDPGTEIRPDTLQNACWVAGLLVLCRHLSRPLPFAPFAAGVLFGLAAIANTKALLGPALVGLWYLTGRRWHGFEARRAGRELLLLFAGGVLPVLGAIAWFAKDGAAGAFLHYTTLWNLAALSIERDTEVAVRNFTFLVTRQAPFFLAVALGIASFLRTRQPARSLLLFVAVPLTLLWPVNDFYAQHWLASLPLLAVVAGAGIHALCDRSRKAAWSLLVFAGGAFLLAMAMARTPFSPHPNQLAQRALTEYVVATTSRDMPLGVLWTSCGGYMFNADLQYHWAARADLGTAIRIDSGDEPFGEAFVAALERQQVPLVIGRRDPAYDALPAPLREYVDDHFDYGDCVWTRRH